jgi:transketolase
LSSGIGFALNARYEGKDYRTFVVVSDGECNEGSVWEAALCARKHRLSSLTVLVDYNKQQSYGMTSEVLDLEPFADKWRAFGFAVDEVDGHSLEELGASLARAPFQSGRPSVIICHTLKGKGVSFVENNLHWHHKNNPTDEEIRALLAELEVR